MQPRTLAILVVILPLLASNGAYLLSALEGFVPWCMPYTDGCTTISQAGRSGDTIFYYRALVFPYSIILMFTWLYAKNWLGVLHGHATTNDRIIFSLGLTGAVALLVYIDFLGTTGEANVFMRRTGAVLYFTMTPLAQVLLLVQHYRILHKNHEASIKPGVLKYQLVIVLLMLSVVVAGAYFMLTDDITYETENIVEWNFSLLINLYFAGMALMWKDYKFVYINSAARNN